MARLSCRLQLLACLALVVPAFCSYYTKCYRCDPCHGHDRIDVEENIEFWDKIECPKGLCVKREGKLTGAKGGYTTSRGCYYRSMTTSYLDIYDECRNLSYSVNDVHFKGTLCVCDSELCNDATTWLPPMRIAIVCILFIIFGTLG